MEDGSPSSRCDYLMDRGGLHAGSMTRTAILIIHGLSTVWYGMIRALPRIRCVVPPLSPVILGGRLRFTCGCRIFHDLEREIDPQLTD
ncbi:hypothetical protein BDV59DRAFT_170133 [Aspergillus ambiguus]|uniref:uncharacterized protein n=1 Tax=Aspergillus ambiguus TaxID=176160 RepID=UPI003CCDFD70